MYTCANNGALSVTGFLLVKQHSQRAVQNQKKSEVLHDDHLRTVRITASKVVVPATKAITPLFILVHVLLAVEATLLPLAGDSGAQVLRGETEREEHEFFLLLIFFLRLAQSSFFSEYPISEKILVG